MKHRCFPRRGLLKKSSHILATLAAIPLALGGVIVVNTPTAEAATYCTHGTTKVNVSLRPDEGYAWSNWNSKPRTQKFRARLLGKGKLPDLNSDWRTTSGQVKTKTMPWVGVGGSACENRNV